MPPKLMPHQEEGVEWLVRVRRGILADEMGLGKTAQALHAADRLDAERVLIVTKKSLTWNVVAEIEKWELDGEVQILTTRTPLSETARWIITNYETAVRRRDLLERTWDVLIVDEAHRIKNPRAQRTQAVWKLSRQAPFVWLLTGTLVVNNRPDEVWALLHALDRRRYSSYWKWRKEYCLEEDVWAGGRVVATRVVGVKNPEALRRELSQHVLQRSKAELNLPPKVYETIRVRMEGKQARMYRQMLKSYMAEAGGQVLLAKNAMVRLLRLQQITADPRLLGDNAKSAKTEAILELLEDETETRKALVFAPFAQYIKLLEGDLKAKGIGVVRITGDVSASERQKAAQAFQEDPSVRVLCGTYEALGEGLNLTAADLVIHASLPWRPTDMWQAEDRAHRTGQTKTVQVISVVADGSVDEYVAKALEKKVGVIDALALYQEILESGVDTPVGVG